MPARPKTTIDEGLNALLRTHRGPLTQRQIADACQCSHTVIRTIEQNALKKIGEAFIERGIMPRRIHEEPRPVRADEFFEGSDYRDSDEFIGFRSLVEAQIRNAKQPMTIADLKRAMKNDYNANWIRDALEVSRNVERIPGYLDRFKWVTASNLRWPADEFQVAKASRKISPDLGL